ncbi:MAG TPA: EAL domain-containing protein [Limnobacter sp.]|nr:EAL domain-containing protein [Limnobacter sp.]
MPTEQDAPRIIVVDDSDDDFLLIKRQLQKTWPSAIVRHAHCEDMLRSILQETDPDLVICDYSMPSLTHERAIELIQFLRPDTPTILLSGLVNEAMGIQAMQEGASDYVEKAKPDRLIPAVRRELDTHRLRREKILLEQAHHRAAYFDEASGFLNRQGLIKALEGVDTDSPQSPGLTLLSINIARNQARRPEADPRMRRNTLEKFVSQLRESFHRDVLCRWSDHVFVVLTQKLDWNDNPSDIAYCLGEVEAELRRVVLDQRIVARSNMRLGLARPGLHGRHAAELVTHAQAVANVLESRGQELMGALAPEIHELAKRRKAIELGLARGIEKNELVLDFQPVAVLPSGEVCGLEALVRWTHPELGRIMPSEFIEIAEDSGLIDALGDWVLECSSRKVLELHQQGHVLWCAVNCSAGQLLNPDFPAKALQTISSVGLDPKWIEFEVTESAAISDMARTVDALQKLQAKGSRIAMDDFGTGYASLNYLRQLPVDVLKIDKSFVMGLLEDQNSHMIVKAVIDLAHALGLQVHAEGIETAEQRDTLVRMGCNRLQGYLLSRPMDIEQLKSWLNENRPLPQILTAARPPILER